MSAGVDRELTSVEWRAYITEPEPETLQPTEARKTTFGVLTTSRKLAYHMGCEVEKALG
jgi:hypothetical protein